MKIHTSKDMFDGNIEYVHYEGKVIGQVAYLSNCLYEAKKIIPPFSEEIIEKYKAEGINLEGIKNYDTRKFKEKSEAINFVLAQKKKCEDSPQISLF